MEGSTRLSAHIIEVLPARDFLIGQHTFIPSFNGNSARQPAIPVSKRLDKPHRGQHGD
jgi:hypothetical protein